MDAAVSLIEKLVNTVHYSTQYAKVIASQPQKVREAFSNKDVDSWKRNIGNGSYLANTTDVVLR